MNGRQLLQSYISANTSQAQFARDIGCSDSHLSLILSGGRGPSLKLAQRIEELSGVPMGAFAQPEGVTE